MGEKLKREAELLMGNGVENIFLTYANNLICDDPKTLIVLLEAIENFFFPNKASITLSFKKVKFFTHIIVETLQQKETVIHDASAFVETLPSFRKQLYDNIITKDQILYTLRNISIYNEILPEIPCNEQCDKWNRYVSNFDPKYLSCIVCEQHIFIAILESLIEKQNSVPINDFINNRMALNENWCEIDPNTTVPYNMDLHPVWPKRDKKLFDWIIYRCGSPDQFMYAEFLNGIIAYSLNEFRDIPKVKGRNESKDFRTLRKCKQCGKFFIGPTCRANFCSDNCKVLFDPTRQRKQYLNRKQRQSSKEK